MKLPGFLGIVLLISSILHVFSAHEITSLYDRNVILTQENGQLKADALTLDAVNSAAIAETRETYLAQNTALRSKLDSLEKARDIKLDEVIQGTVINTSYVSDNMVSAQVDPPGALPEPGELLQLPVSCKTPCWSMMGVIKTTDPVAQFKVTEQTANNSVQLLVLKPRKFLGFLWRTKKEQFRIYSDCGEATIAGVNFIDQ